jgi:hypothetical protein
MDVTAKREAPDGTASLGFCREGNGKTQVPLQWRSAAESHGLALAALWQAISASFKPVSEYLLKFGFDIQ